MIARIDLLRHGETTTGKGFRGSTDDELTAKGQQQMRNALARDLGWDQIITSPLRRCAQPAHILAQERGYPLVEDARLREMHFGRWEGLETQHIMQTDAKLLSQFWQNPLQHTPPDGETLLEVCKRVEQVFSTLATDYANRRHVLMVTHAGVIRIVLCLVTGHPLHKLLDFSIPHASLHTLLYQPGTDVATPHSWHHVYRYL